MLILNRTSKEYFKVKQKSLEHSLLFLQILNVIVNVWKCFVFVYSVCVTEKVDGMVLGFMPPVTFDSGTLQIWPHDC